MAGAVPRRNLFLEILMSPSRLARPSSLALCSLAVIASCAGSSPPPPDAAPAPPTSPAGSFAVTSTFDLRPPAAAAPVFATLTAASDGPDDPTRFVVDHLVASLPAGTVKELATAAAPYLAAYLNARLADLAPRLAPGLAALAGGLTRIAGHLETREAWQLDRTGAGVRTITGVQFALGGATTAVRLADHGLADLAVGVRVALDPAGRVTIAGHDHRVPYGALLRIGLDRVVVPSVEPGARDLASALAALVDCERLAAAIAVRIGLGAPTIYRAACRAALTAIASELDARIAAIDATPLALEVAGSADAFDDDGDGRIDQLRAGRWIGAVVAGADRAPLDAGTFTASAAGEAGPVTGRAAGPGSRSASTR